MPDLRILPPLVLGIILWAGSSAHARPAFGSSEMEAPGAEILFCDLDGDHLKDAVVVDGLKALVFYQDANQGFSRSPQRQLHLERRPCAVWAARLGKSSESLLIMTSEGVAELCFTDRSSSPVSRPIIREQTVLPATLDDPQAIHFPFSVDTGTDRPLLLVPAATGLQVWSTSGAAAENGPHRGLWRQVQVIEQAMEAHTWPSVANPGYHRVFGLNMNLSDVNHDGRGDLLVMRNAPDEREVYTVYLQKADGLFTSEPTLTCTNRFDWRTSLYWIDLNRDGKLDLVKSTFADEPSFIPIIPSGKVLVGIYLADGQGRLPAEPQQVFRKSDWSCSLPMVDLDGDGYIDLVLGNVPISTREGFRKAVTAEEMDLHLRCYFQQPGALFPKEPDCQRNLLFRFHHQLFFELDLSRLYSEQFVSLNGDFNGDGKKDLLVRDRGSEISVYGFLSRGKGFSTEADIRFRCPEPVERWQVEDLNGDGVSDLVVKLWNRNIFRVFTSQRK